MTEEQKEHYERADERLLEAVVQIEKAIGWIEDISEVIAQGNVDELERLVTLIDQKRVALKFQGYQRGGR